MALNEVRRELRIQALETAAAMIQGHLEAGATPEETELDEDSFRILGEENIKIAKKLFSMAEKLKRKL